MTEWTIEDAARLIECLEDEHVVATPEDVLVILRKLEDKNDPDQTFFREKISA
jgi:hypothetical protein